MFSIAGTVKGMALAPRPSVIAIGIGRQHMGGVVFLVEVLSRITAQPAVLTTSTLRPWFCVKPERCGHDDRPLRHGDRE